MALAGIVQYVSYIETEVDTLVQTPFTHCYGTNFSAARPSTEKIQLDDIIDTMTPYYSELKTIIGRLSQARVKLVLAIKAHSRFASIIGRIPEDVLSIIFYYAHLPSYEDIYSDRLGCTLRLNVAQVCQRWRMVALGAPKLWHRILIDAKREQSRLESTAPARCDELISRSRSLPVSLFIRYRDLSNLYCLNDTGLLDRLSDSCTGMELIRSRHALPVESWVEMDAFLCRFTLKLKFLSLRWLPVYNDPTRPLTFYIHLTSIHIQLHQTQDSPNASVILQLPSPNLRRLSLDNTSSRSCMYLDISHLSENFPRLEELYIQSRLISLPSLSASERSLLSQSDAPTQLPYLRVLCILTTWDNEMERLLQHVALPRLSEVMIGCTYYRMSFPASIAEPLEALFSRSHCSLKEINFYDAEVGWVDEWINHLREIHSSLRTHSFDGKTWDIVQVTRSWLD